MKSTLFIGATLVASSMAYSMKEATRIRRNLPAFAPPTTGASAKCTFLSLDELFPTDMLSVLKNQPDEDQTQIGNNYYGGWTKTVTVPSTKAYQYYVTRSDVIEITNGVASGWTAIQDGQQKSYHINLCDNPQCTDNNNVAYTGTGNTDGLLLTTTGTFEGFDTNLQVIKEMDPDKQPISDDLINNLHGSFTCGDSEGLGVIEQFVSNGLMACQFLLPRLDWYFGVSSLCHHTATATADNIFAWYVQNEPNQKFTLNTLGATEGDCDGLGSCTVSGLHINSNNPIDETGVDTNTAGEILFSAPLVAPVDTTSTYQVFSGAQQVSWIKKVESTVKYSFSGQTVPNAPPTRCSVNSGVKLSIVQNIGGSPTQVDGLVDEFASECKVSMEASIDVGFSDEYHDALCDTSLDSVTGKQQAQIETTLVQFARIHENRTLPTLQNNTANRFFAAYNRAGQFDPVSGLPDADLSGPTTGEQSDWACLDDCAVGDPFIVLGHRKVTVLKADAIDPTTQADYTDARLKLALDYTISANIEAATLSSPNTAMSGQTGVVGDLTPWSYVMGITDYTISECGAKNFDNSNTFDGEYSTTTGTTTTARRLGSAMPKSVIRKSVINFGSYKGFE